MVVEPISAALGAAKAIGILIKVSREVIQYVKDTKGALTQREKLLSEITATTEILVQLKSKTEDDEWKPTLDALNAPNGPFDQFKEIMETLSRKLSPVQSTSKKVIKSSTWHFTKPEVTETLAAVERFKSLLSLALQNRNA